MADKMWPSYGPEPELADDGPTLMGMSVVNDGYWLTWVRQDGYVYSETWAVPVYFMQFDSAGVMSPSDAAALRAAE